MDLPTYTNIWRIEKRLYKLYDFRLPMPLPVGQIAVFMVIAVPYILILSLLGLPFSHTLVWVYVLPPGVLAWLTTRPVLEGKRLPELITSQVRYLLEPRSWARMSPLAEKDEVIIVCRVWRAAAVPVAEAAGAETPQVTESRPAVAAGSVATAGLVAGAGPVAVAGKPARPASRRPVRQQRPAPRPLALPARSGRPRTLTSGPAAASPATASGPVIPDQAIRPAIPGPAIPGPAGPGPFRTHAPGQTAAADAPAGQVTPGQAGPGPFRTHAPGQTAAAAAAAGQVTPGPLPRRQPTRELPGQAHPADPAATHGPVLREPAAPGPAAASPAARPAAPSPAAQARPAHGHAGPGWPMRDPIARGPGAHGAAARGPGAHGAAARGSGAHGAAAQEPVAHVPAEAEQPARGPAGHGHLGPGWPVQDPADPTRVAPEAAETVLAAAPDRTIPVPPARPAADRVAPGWPAHDPSAAARPGERHAGPDQAGRDQAGRDQAGQERSGAGWPVRDPSAPGSGQPGGPPQWLHPRRPEPEQAESDAEESGAAAAEPEQRPARPVVRVTGDHHPERPLRVVERALRSQPGQRHDGWRERVVIVPGGHRPGKPDQLQRDRARARLPLSGPRRVVVLGCTRGAGQTMTALLAGDMLAALRAEPVAVLDLNPGRGSLTERAAEIPGLVRDPDAPAPDDRSGQAALGLQVISGAAAARGGDEAGRILDLVAGRYALTLADPAAGCVPRALEVADQLLIVAPASAEAANALAMTFEWLEAHGYRRLADGAITVINGVSRPTSAHAEHAASVATGRCRAIVKVPWDNQLKAMAASRIPAAQAGAGSSAVPGSHGRELAAPVDPRGASALSPALSHAYTALAGVLIASLAEPDELRSARG